MLPVILMCALMVKITATRNVTVSLGTPKSCFFLGDNVKLICAVSSESNCCNSSRFWRDKNGTNILNDGAPSDASKYKEDYDGGTTGYNLIIKNVQKSDLGTNYTCVYRFKKDVLFLSMDKICPSSEVDISGNCWKDAVTSFGWSFLGTVIGTVIIIIAKVIIKIVAKAKICDTCVLRDGSLFIISVVFNVIVALPIGYYTCHCVDETYWLLILLGLIPSLITGVIPLIYKLIKGDDLDFTVECYLQALAVLCTGCLEALCKGRRR